MGYGSSSRGNARVIWICLHTAEGARSARSLAAFFNGNPNASSHAACDTSETIEMVPYSRGAWTLGPGNPYSDNLEMCAFARWSRAQWLSTGTVDGCPNPRGIVRNAARWAKARCDARGISYHRVGIPAVSGWRESVIHHDDYTKGSGWGSHWDCGTGFPWDVLLADMGAATAPVDDPGAGMSWPLPGGHYYGPIDGPERSHGGFYPAERPVVRMIQQRFQALGHAPTYAAWADGVWEQPTTDACRAWQRAAGLPVTGHVAEADWAALFGGEPSASAPSPPSGGGAPPFPLPRGEYFGLVTGPAESHGGYYGWERPHVRRIQRALIGQGYVPGIGDPNSGWADGLYEQPTAEAVTRFQRAEMPGTTYFGQVWWDDWAQLLG